MREWWSGEMMYPLTNLFGLFFDSPDTVAMCVIIAVLALLFYKLNKKIHSVAIERKWKNYYLTNHNIGGFSIFVVIFGYIFMEFMLLKLYHIMGLGS